MGLCQIGIFVFLLLRRSIAALVLGRRKLKVPCTVDYFLRYEHGMLSFSNYNSFFEELKIAQL
jgi:hypothetical protein